MGLEERRQLYCIAQYSSYSQDVEELVQCTIQLSARAYHMISAVWLAGYNLLQKKKNPLLFFSLPPSFFVHGQYMYIFSRTYIHTYTIYYSRISRYIKHSKCRYSSTYRMYVSAAWQAADSSSSPQLKHKSCSFYCTSYSLKFGWLEYISFLNQTTYWGKIAQVK